MSETIVELRPSLPSPADRPEADVVIFDGECRFCVAQIRQLTWWDRGGRLAFLSLHDAEVARRFPDLSPERLMAEMVVVDGEGNRFGGADAIRYLSRRLPRLWWLAPWMHLPGAMLVWRPVYRWIARNRYRFGRIQNCEQGTCALHHGRSKQ